MQLLTACVAKNAIILGLLVVLSIAYDVGGFGIFFTSLLSRDFLNDNIMFVLLLFR